MRRLTREENMDRNVRRKGRLDRGRARRLLLARALSDEALMRARNPGLIKGSLLEGAKWRRISMVGRQ